VLGIGQGKGGYEVSDGKMDYVWHEMITETQERNKRGMGEKIRQVIIYHEGER